MDVKGIIKKRRIEMQLTLKDVAEKVGVNEGTVSRWSSIICILHVFILTKHGSARYNNLSSEAFIK